MFNAIKIMKFYNKNRILEKYFHIDFINNSHYNYVKYYRRGCIYLTRFSFLDGN